MADNATNLDLIAQHQAQQEVTANALFNAMSPASYFALRSFFGLTWRYYGGVVRGGSPPGHERIPNGELTLAASDVNYVEHTLDGDVSSNVAGFTAGSRADYVVTTDADGVTDYLDVRGLYVEPTTLATGAAHTVDDVIALLQALGLCKQA